MSKFIKKHRGWLVMWINVRVARIVDGHKTMATSALFQVVAMIPNGGVK